MPAAVEPLELDEPAWERKQDGDYIWRNKQGYIEIQRLPGVYAGALEQSVLADLINAEISIDRGPDTVARVVEGGGFHSEGSIPA